MIKLPLSALTILSVNFCFGFASPISAEELLYWQGASRHSFCMNFPVGSEADGRMLFSSQTDTNHTKLRDILIDDSGGISGVDATYVGSSPQAEDWHGKKRPGEWHLGKAGIHFKNGMTYSYGGKEKDVGPDTFLGVGNYGHSVLCLTQIGDAQRDRLVWETGSNGGHPTSPVMGFNASEGQIVCRANWGGGVHPGKLIPSSSACFIGYGGGEKAVREYEVLAVKEFSEVYSKCEFLLRYSNVPRTCWAPKGDVYDVCQCPETQLPGRIVE